MVDLNDIKKNIAVQDCIKKFNITDEKLSSIPVMRVLTRFIKTFTYCDKEEPLVNCKQIIPGIQEWLTFENGNFYIVSKKCKHWEFENPYHLIEKYVLYSEFNLITKEIDIAHYIKKLNQEKNIDEQRKHFLKTFIETKDKKGIYLWGSIGAGKTYLLKLCAVYYLKKEKTVTFISIGGLAKSIKDSFASDENKSNLNKCYKADILFLDDLGCEQETDWFKDEILLPLLSFRYENKLLTYFSSNYSIEQLNSKWSAKRKNDLVPVNRLIDRIKALGKESEIKGNSRRY
ncbi:ATP-binding protein [Spiroplasma endosymbiont of Crioceris asparagi]|uniref:ATP-binding protein n=1 Tax=Spiroplasma endosymbiont of Crioceris asparagi TaxID=3066286 RepID=UPI0030CF53F5